MESRKIEIIILFALLFVNIFMFLAIISPRISGFFILNNNVKGPSDFISEEQIAADNNSVVIKIKNPILFRYNDSDSMQPVLGFGVNGVGFKPSSPEQINVGDIINFEQNGLSVVHRVIEKGTDSRGVYFITKGDNNNLDDGKIRFEQIDSVLVALIY